MKQYLSVFRIRFIHGLQYRAAAYAGISTQFAWGFMFILLFRAFYQSDASVFPMSFSQLSSYIWLQQSLLMLFASGVWDHEAMTAIKDGNIAYELARPTNLYCLWFVRNLALRSSRAVLRCAPILVVAIFLPKPYGLSPPAGPVAFILFLVTGLLAFCTVVAFGMLISISTFYTMDSLGLRTLAMTMTEIMTGALIPLPFMPDPVRRMIELTPFAYMQNLPLNIYNGYLEGNAILKGLLIQSLWLVVLVLAGSLWMKNSLKRVVVQGG